MTFEYLCVIALCTLAAFCGLLWRRVETLFTAVAKLANGHSEHVKYSAGLASDIAEQYECLENRLEEAEKKIDELPTDRLKELTRQEENFVDGLNNILNYSIQNYGLNKDGVNHE